MNRTQKTSNYRILLTLVLLTLVSLFACDLGPQPTELGNAPIGTPADDDAPTSGEDIVLPGDSAITWERGSLYVYVSPSDIPASTEDSASVHVRIYNDAHNPVVGRTVHFGASHGMIYPESSSTSHTGETHATFLSQPINTTAYIWASIFDEDSNRVDAVYPVTLSGVTVTIMPSSTNLLTGSTADIAILVTDARGNAVPNREVVLSGGIVDTMLTNGKGRVETTLTRSSQGQVALQAASQGARARDTLMFWNTLPDDQITDVTSIRQLRVFSSKTQINADNSSQAVITAVLLNEHNNPATGDSIRFHSDLGIIDQYAVVDSSGRARADLVSSPVNGTCTIWAVPVGRTDSASTRVIFSGVSLQLSVDPTDLKINEYAFVEALLRDASGNAIGEEQITFSVTGGQFADGSQMMEKALGADGKSTVRVTSNTAGTAVITASAQNAGDSATVSFTNNTLSLTANPGVLHVSSSTDVYETTLRATYRDGSNNNLTSELVVFYTNAGEITDDSVYTNANGVAATTLRSAAFSGVATVRAVAATGSDETQVRFRSVQPAQVDLRITPDNIRVNGGMATLIATVTDSNGNVVTGADVNFRILRGPGGDEYIDKPVASTEDGVARSTIYAGSLPSQYRACRIAAFTGLIADTSKMTISGEPHIITVSRPQDDTVRVEKAGQLNESTFDYYVGAVVQDVNGNYVADGTEVHFSAVVSGLRVGRRRFVRWKGEQSSADEIKPVIDYNYLDVPFEDINNNMQMDPGIDLTIDYNDAMASRGDDVNGDGVMDYDWQTHDFFYDFNFNGVCDTGVGEPSYYGDSNTVIYADLNRNGQWDSSELVRDHNGDGVCDLPASGDFPYWRWEQRGFFEGQRFDFHENDYAVVIAATATTENGVAKARLTYPRQMARRLIVTVNAETNGIRDKDGERFSLPVIVQ